MQKVPDFSFWNATRDELVDRIKYLENRLDVTNSEANFDETFVINSLFNSLPIGIAYVDNNQIYRFTNEKYREFLNLSPTTLLGKSIAEVLAPETYNIAKVAMDKVFAGTSVTFQVTLIIDAETQHLNVTYLPDFREDQSIVGFFAFVQDVTTQYDLQNELRGSELRYQLLVDAIPYGIEEIDTEGTILFANATHHKQYGYDPNELIGMNIGELEPTAEDAEKLARHLQKVLLEQPQPEPYYGKKTKRNGELMDAQVGWTYKRDLAGHITGFIAIISDITKQKAAERLQKESADRLELSLRSANIGTFSWNIIENTSYWDERMHAIWGLKPGSFLDHKHKDFEKTIHPDDRDLVNKAIAKSLEDDTPFDTEYRIYRPDGQLVYVEVLASVSRSEQGQPFRLNGVCLDISERKIIEKMKSEFVSTVSHELRTPLTSIRGALGLIAGGALGDIPDKAMDIIHLAEKNASSLSRLVNDILDFERADSGELEFNYEEFELIAFLEINILSHQGLADKYAVQFQLTFDAPEIHLQADADRIAQVMANLLSNAAKYAPRNGTVAIDVKSDAEYVEVFVADGGAGIPEEFQAKIFDRFTQASATDDRNFGGAGLGLSICKLIVDQHHGEIDFESSPDHGTAFHFKIPRRKIPS